MNGRCTDLQRTNIMSSSFQQVLSEKDSFLIPDFCFRVGAWTDHNDEGICVRRWWWWWGGLLVVLFCMKV